MNTADRTTSELIEALGDDIDRSHRESIDAGERADNGDIYADYEYHARQLVRAIFAFIEAVTFSVKAKAAEYCLRRKRYIPDAERLLAVDIELVLSDKGEIVERPAHIRLADNIRFSPCRKKSSASPNDLIHQSNGGRASNRRSRCGIDLRTRSFPGTSTSLATKS